MSLFRLCSYGKDKHIAKGFTQNVCYMLLKSSVKLFAKAGRQRAKQSIEARQHPSYPSILLAKCQKTSRWRTTLNAVLLHIRHQAHARCITLHPKPRFCSTKLRARNIPKVLFYGIYFVK